MENLIAHKIKMIIGNKIITATKAYKKANPITAKTNDEPRELISQITKTKIKFLKFSMLKRNE